MTRVIYIAVILSLVGCVTRQPEETLRWKKADFVGKTFSLDHPTQVQDISFSSKSRMAPLTFGARDGKQCAPLFFWRLKGPKLEVYDSDSNTVYESFALLSKDDHTVTVINRNGERVTYQVK